MNTAGSRIVPAGSKRHQAIEALFVDDTHAF
jgi:hypothetical protein